MTIPDRLQRNRDFMFLYRLALLGTTNTQRDDVDRLIALAYSAGTVDGATQIVAAVTVPTP